jgi:hypothetical protein
MRRWLVIGMAWGCLLHSPAWPASREATTAKRAATSKSEWPDSPSGVLARRWVEAFSKGEKAMRKTLPEILSAQGLAKTSMDERMERYRGMHERLGSLMLVEVRESTADSLVVLLASSELSQLPFTFKFQSGPPIKLLSVSMMDRVHSHGGGFSH